jgi:GT2 family glycosyltransferase
MYLEETDFQRRLAAGGIQPHLIASSNLTHYGSAQKTWAQAGQHYLRSLKIYSQRWWSPMSRACIKPVILLSAIISLLSLAIAFVPSMLIWKSHLRVRHYLRSYISLLHNLVRS